MADAAQVESIRILCIDDGSLGASACIGDLLRAPFAPIVTIVANLDSALVILRETWVDYVVVSESLVERSGESSIEQIESSQENVAVIVGARSSATESYDLAEQILYEIGASSSRSKSQRQSFEAWTRQSRQKKLEDIASQERLTASERLARILDLGIQEFGLKGAVVTDIAGDEARVLDCLSTGDSIHVGLSYPAEVTFCRHVLDSDEPVSIPNIGESFLHGHPGRLLFGIESYFGCRISGSPDNQTTLSFVGDTPTEWFPSAEDHQFIRTLAFRVGVELRNRQHEDELSLTRALFETFMNNSPVVATLKDSQGVYRYVNRISDSSLATWLQAHEGQNDRSAFLGPEYEVVHSADLRVLARGETLQFRQAISTPEEGVRFWHIMKFPVIAPSIGPCVGSVALDITPQVEAEFQLEKACEATLDGWTRTLEIRDRETQGHSRRVADMAVQLARRLNMPEGELIHVWRGALLHDLGKIGIPDAVLSKDGPLTKEEWEIMKKHPEIAVNMLAAIPFLAPAMDIPHCHHERWDGKGYPRGLSKEEIPRSARVFAVVDVYDALTSDRPYRSALTNREALDYIRNVAGTHFDPAVAEEFLKMMTEANNSKLGTSSVPGA